MKLSEMSGESQADQDGDAFNIAPLIDVVFILLIFFMVTTTFDQQEQMEIERPQASESSVSVNTPVRVYIDATGRIRVLGQDVSSWSVKSTVQGLLADRQHSDVIVVADHRVETGRLVEVVDACRGAGGSPVGVSVESP